jgi:hypothetical protein
MAGRRRNPLMASPCPLRPFGEALLTARLTTERVAEPLGVMLADLGPLLEGRVAPPASALRKLREAVA